jgi:hypothetical protein
LEMLLVLNIQSFGTNAKLQPDHPLIVMNRILIPIFYCSLIGL